MSVLYYIRETFHCWFSNINTVIFLINLRLNIDLEIYDVNLFVECSKGALFLTPNH